MIADWGIYLEMGGFILMLIFWKIPTRNHEKRWKQLFKKWPKLTKDNYPWHEINASNIIGINPIVQGKLQFPKWFVYTWIFLKYLGLAIILGGLLLQQSEINNWIFNNFPEI